ncbi:MAG TPA: cohesin domain-containing protein [Verrucomicrobiae bacterium]|nr:cohesin domain-containing protein [Verrucomicrobiae bacterium]
MNGRTPGTTRGTPATRVALVLPAVLLSLWSMACGGGGGGGDDHNGGVAPVADFAPSCDTGAGCFASSVTLQKRGVAGGLVLVDAVLNKLGTPIGVASFVIHFDPSAVDYQSYATGTALGGSPGTVYTVTESAPGELVVTILPPAGGMSTSTAKPMITLTFAVLKIAVTGVTFENTDILNGSALYDPAGTLMPLGAGAWSGGLISGS